MAHDAPVAVDLADLRLEGDRLAHVRDVVRAKIDAGLRTDGEEVRALNAWLKPPAKGLEGRALVVDAGGTNVRAAVVEVGPGRSGVVAGPKGARLEVRDTQRTAAQFYAQQTDLAAALDAPPGLPLGYCFSYPSTSLPDGDAELITWTKGIDIPEVVGSRVGAALQGALNDRGITTGQLVVLNDTVAALLAGAPHAADPKRTIGLIVGTGTNMAAFFSGKDRKLESDDVLAVNLESGNITPPLLTALDDAVDAASNNPGQQRFEKAVSGHFLPQLFRAACPELDINPAAGAEVLAQHAGADTRQGEIARALLDRSADLVGAGLAAVADLLDGEGEVTVLAEGGLFWNAHGYPERVTAAFDRLNGSGLEIRHIEHANLIGSAVAALA
jgi:hexokinase